MKNPTGINNLISGALKRHGIEKQVTSAMIVDHARRFLIELLPPELQTDIQVTSYQFGELIIDCRHSTAANEAQNYTPLLQIELQKYFPTLTISKIFCRLRSSNFNQPEHW